MIKEERKHGVWYVAMLLTVSVILCACKSDKGKIVEVAGEEITSITGTEVVNTVQNMGEESTKTTEQNIQIETTTSEQTISNYIYDKDYDDMNKIWSSGETSITNEEIQTLESLLRECDFNISVKAVSIDGTKCISYNTDKGYFAASAIKAPYLLYCYKQTDVSNGTFDEEMVYTSKYYRSGTGDIKNSAEGTKYTLHEIMRRTIWNSDNSAYLMCTERWGKDGYNELMESFGVDRLKLPERSIWVFDVKVDDFVIVWKQIYDYFQTGTEGARAFYDSTTNCKWNFFGQGISKCVIAQKYGWAEESFLNAGIVYGENETYILAVFTDAEGDNADKKLYGDIVGEIHKLMDK